MCGPKCRCQKCYEMHGSGPMVTNKMTTPTDTPRTDACPHCGSPRISPLCAYFTCEADTTQRDEDKRTHLCRERDKSQKLEAEVERLKSDKTHLITQCANLLEELSEIKETYASIVQQPHFDEREVHCSCVPALRAEVERLTNALDQMTLDALATAKDRDEWMTRALVAGSKEGK